MPLIWPALRPKAASSNSLTITPRPNQPRSPPCPRLPGSADNSMASAAKSSPARARRATSSACARAEPRVLQQHHELRLALAVDALRDALVPADHHAAPVPPQLHALRVRQRRALVRPVLPVV